MDPPRTPTHVAPDVEVDLPDQPFMNSDLELNPDLEDDDDNLQDSTELTHNYLEEVDSSVDILDVDASNKVELWTLPFDIAFDYQKKQFREHSNQPTVSEWQQSRFVNYIDGELLQLQRNFIKGQAENEEVYPLHQLLEDLGKILDLIWYLINDKNKLYGQDEYFIRITGDLEDWIDHYQLKVDDVTNSSNEAYLFKFFTFFQSLDTRLSFLIDGYTVGGSDVEMSSTEIIRLIPIVTRLRLLIVTKLDPSRAKLTHLKALGDVDANALLNKLDVEIGRLFEGTLERS